MFDRARLWKSASAVVLCAFLCACAAPPKEVPNVALPPAPPPGEPQGVVGLDQAALRVAFGPPVFVRNDGKAEMWRYDGASCRAFFFLYPQDRSFAVRHVETVPRGRDIAADANCLAEIRAHAATPLS